MFNKNYTVVIEAPKTFKTRNTGIELLNVYKKTTVTNKCIPLPSHTSTNKNNDSQISAILDKNSYYS